MRRDEHARGLISQMLAAHNERQSADEWYATLKQLVRDAADEDAIGTMWELAVAAADAFRRAAEAKGEDVAAYFQRWALEDAADNEIEDDDDGSEAS